MFLVCLGRGANPGTLSLFWFIFTQFTAKLQRLGSPSVDFKHETSFTMQASPYTIVFS
jgi:hypothetical protein